MRGVWVGGGMIRVVVGVAGDPRDRGVEAGRTVEDRRGAARRRGDW